MRDEGAVGVRLVRNEVEGDAVDDVVGIVMLQVCGK